MRAEVRWIEANDIREWPHWSPSKPAEEYQRFTVSIGIPDNLGADTFQVAVATLAGRRERQGKCRFVGLLVERFDPHLVEQAIREFVADSEALTWEGVVQQLQVRMRWEYGQ